VEIKNPTFFSNKLINRINQFFTATDVDNLRQIDTSICHNYMIRMMGED